MFLPFPPLYQSIPITLNLINMFFYYLARIKPDFGQEAPKLGFHRKFKEKLVGFFYKDPENYDFNQ